MREMMRGMILGDRFGDEMVDIKLSTNCWLVCCCFLLMVVDDGETDDEMVDDERW